jgi:phosphoribosylanthranilate isomerase
MDTLDVKICGLSTAEAVDAVIAGGGSHAGFIFFEKSPRHVDLADAAALAARARAGGLKTVAVIVNADDPEISRIVSDMKPDILQLHGKETPQRLTDIRQMTGLEVWKALSIAQRADLTGIDRYRQQADRLLLDAKPPAGSELPGGNAVSFDWTILAAANPPGLDVSSGVESTPGIKDIDEIAAFLKAVRTTSR